MKTFTYEAREYNEPLEIVVFNDERLTKLLQSSKNIKRDDRDILLEALEIIIKLYKSN